MWWLPQSLLRLLATLAGGQMGWRLGAGGINNDEAFAGRINRDLHLEDFQKGMDVYKADPAYWHKFYGSDPQYSNSHTPDPEHGGLVPPSRYFNIFPIGTSSDTPPNAPNIPRVIPNESSFLDPTPMNPKGAGPFSTGGQFVPPAVSSQSLYPSGSFNAPPNRQPLPPMQMNPGGTTNLVTPQSAPNTLTSPSQNPFGNGVGNWPSTVTPATPFYAAPPADQPGGLPGMLLDYLHHNPRSTQTSPTQAMAPSQSPNSPQASPPLQPDETALTDDQPQRFLGRRTYSLSDPLPTLDARRLPPRRRRPTDRFRSTMPISNICGA